jgi:hypothetical protein
MLNLFNSDAGPMPECMSIWGGGVSSDPTHIMTSFEAKTVIEWYQHDVLLSTHI